MEKVVYILGAGFSAPAGLPVMANFLEAAQDVFLRDPDKYGHFREIFDLVQDFSSIKSYMASNLLNIEEVLSILEMQSDLREDQTRGRFIRFLREVVEYYSPQWAPHSASVASNWWQQMWGSGPRIHPYGTFVGSLFNPILAGDARGGRTVVARGGGAATYSIITFNYDRLLETLSENAGQFLGMPSAFPFSTAGNEGATEKRVPLVKLHGDAREGTIVPPTWSKSASADVLPAWKEAHELLREATCIRVLGYSLPPGDAYFKYLLKAAQAEGRVFRKQIDILCLDPDGAVEKRYRDLFVFPKLRFLSADVLSYLGKIAEGGHPPNRLQQDGAGYRPYSYLEAAHEQFFRDRLEGR